MSELTFRELLGRSKERVVEARSEGGVKRVSKHAPKEISSKIHASKVKPVKFYKPGEDPESGTFIKKFKPRDPRFEKYSGHFNQGLFEASYTFIDEIREKELKEIESALQDPRFSDQHDQLRKVYLKKKQEITRIKDQKRELQVKRKLIREEKQKVKTGKRPYFFKKGLVKMMALKEKIEEMKENGTYDAYKRKKRKREISGEKSGLWEVEKKRRSF